MLTKIIVIILMLIIIGALFNGLICLVRGKKNSMAKSLSWRIGISVTLFIFLFIAFKFNLLTPHGLLGATNAFNN